MAGRSVVLKLRGIIYGGRGHFTCRVIRPTKDVWFHDGITTGRACVREGHLDDFQSEALRGCRGKTVVAIVYALNT
ncbi:hypothetical protein C8R44DRAFT_636655 [Mycena epipterygia]|nr:hypothetical protein C8R44DRAFT_654001 [Mycena epipterygia]KAJ7102077.1 hypothetical protein C8R44DRAFT_641179 [Mycena epipterygia]KAJ7108098.1 hypothetical protein C8R44DRAFT_636655 [Mycena epipterygia]